MWQMICDIYERHTLLNKLSARRKFYTATMKDGERVLEFSARIRQLASTLKSMGVTVDNNEMAMALLNGLPEKFDSLISALDAIGSDDQLFTFEFVSSRCEQEEQRQSQRHVQAITKSETAALIADKAKPEEEMCVHCHKHRNSNRCYRKYPHLAPKNRPYRNRKALVGRDSNTNSTSDSEEVCLISLSQVEEITCKDTQSPLEISEELELDDFNLLGVPSTPEFLFTNNCLVSSENPKNQHSWILDSGCTAHMTFNRSAFTSYSPISPVSVEFGSESNAQIIGSGSIEILAKAHGKLQKVKFENVKHVPKLRFQLISISAMANRGIRTEFDDEGSKVIRKRDEKLLSTGSLYNGLYYLNLSKSPEKALVASIGRWHERLAHINVSGISNMVKNGVVRGVKLNSANARTSCVGCIFGKGHRAAMPKAKTRQTKSVLELIHSDVIGPIEVESVGGARYVITFIDDKSNWTVEYTMHRKSESLDCFKKYKAYAERHTNQTVRGISFNEFEGSVFHPEAIKLKSLRSDNGGEYLSNDFKSYLELHGIKHELTVAYTPQQNGEAERMNRTLMNLVKKLDPRSREASLMGYSNQSKGYKLWDADIQKTETADSDIADPEPSNDSRSETSNTELSVTSQAHSNPSGQLRRSTRVSNRQSYEEAKSPDNIDFWLPGITKEEESIRKNMTFELVERQSGMHVIPCRYVFRVKADVGPKVRIVAKGFRQIEGVEYYDTYAPVISLTAARLFLAIVSQKNLHCDQMDVVTAFLNGDLTEEVYMEVPAGFRDPKRPNLVCKLLKAIYGLKQAQSNGMPKLIRF
eukprot:IDg23309t1